MIKKTSIYVSPSQAFANASSLYMPTPALNDTLHVIKQLAQQVGFQLQPLGNLLAAQANCTQRLGNNREHNFNNKLG